MAIQLGGIVRRFKTHVISGSHLLLLIRAALKAARGVLDIEDGTLYMMDLRVLMSLDVDGTGHMHINLLPLPTLFALSVDATMRDRRVSFAPSPELFSAAQIVSPPPVADGGTATQATDNRPLGSAGLAPPAPPVAPPGATANAGANGGPVLGRRDSLAVLKAGLRLKAVLEGLHRTYAHPGADRLFPLLHDAGCRDAAIAPMARQVTAAWSASRATRPRPPRAVVTLPRPTFSTIRSQWTLLRSPAAVSSSK